MLPHLFLLAFAILFAWNTFFLSSESSGLKTQFKNPTILRDLSKFQSHLFPGRISDHYSYIFHITLWSSVVGIQTLALMCAASIFQSNGHYIRPRAISYC